MHKAKRHGTESMRVGPEVVLSIPRQPFATVYHLNAEVAESSNSVQSHPKWTASIGDISEEYAGQGNICTSCYVDWMMRAVRGRALWF